MLENLILNDCELLQITHTRHFSTVPPVHVFHIAFISLWHIRWLWQRQQFLLLSLSRVFFPINSQWVVNVHDEEAYLSRWKRAKIKFLLMLQKNYFIYDSGGVWALC